MLSLIYQSLLAPYVETGQYDHLSKVFNGQPFVRPLSTRLVGTMDYSFNGQPFYTLSSASTSIRALIIENGYIQQITNAQIGTGLKPLVLLNGIWQQRATTEGSPIVLDTGTIRIINANETLSI